MAEDTKPKGTVDKKKLIWGGAALLGVVGLYLWFRNSQSSSSSSSSGVNPGDITSYIPIPGPQGAPGSTGARGPAGPPGKTGPRGPAGGTYKKKPVKSVAHKGGKSEIHRVVTKPAVHISGGTIKKSGTTATAKSSKVRAA